MTIDFTQRLGTITGAPLLDEQQGVPLTLGLVSVNALLINFQNEQTTTDDKLKRFRLAQQIHNVSEVTIPIEDVVLIKKLIGMAYGPLIVGQAFEMLENWGEIQ